MGEDFERFKRLSAELIILFSIFRTLGAAFALKPLGHSHP